MDAIELLKGDHRKVEDLFRRFNDGGGVTGVVKRMIGNAASPRQRRTVAERICQELDTHTRIEEQIFYPAVRALHDERLGELVGESVDEHTTITERVAAARGSLDDENDLRERMGSLRDCVYHHVHEEENEMFPLLEQRMPEDERSRLGRELAASKRKSAPRAASPRRRKTTKRARPSQGRRTRKTTAKARKRGRSRSKRAS
jgi:hemerythrin superfamily protein